MYLVFTARSIWRRIKESNLGRLPNLRLSRSVSGPPGPYSPNHWRRVEGSNLCALSSDDLAKRCITTLPTLQILGCSMMTFYQLKT